MLLKIELDRLEDGKLELEAEVTRESNAHVIDVRKAKLDGANISPSTVKLTVKEERRIVLAFEARS